MLPQNHGELTSKASSKLGFPEGIKFYSPYPFGGINLQDARNSIEDNEFFLLENFIKIGNGNLRTLWDKGDAIYTAPAGKTIVMHFFYNIGTTNYAIVFLSDGSAIQVNTATQANLTVGAAGTFYSGGQLPACCQWGSLYLLIVNNITSNNYWVWDGSTLFTHGSLGSSVTITNAGSGYTSAPTVTAFGGTGSGATFLATVANGSVVNVQVTNPGMGYNFGQTVQLIFSGGGSDTGARLQAVLSAGTIDHIDLIDGGSGYTSPVIAITGGGGAGAMATATQTGGIIDAITITNPGAGYTSTPTVGITDGGPGAGASAIAVLNPGNVASVSIINGGTGYNSTPTLAFQGGGGSGATATAILTAGVITGVTVTAHGTGYTSTPAIIVQSGINNAASATATLMPFGVSGSSIETYQQRVWIPFPNQTGNRENGGTFLVSSPGSYTDFATSDGGLIFTSSDPFLRAQYTNIRQSNGYLYPIGDSSVSVISNVQTAGSPATTTFNYQNTDPQIGTSWRDSCSVYSRSILFANPLGVFGLYGGSVTKISDKLDTLFTNAVFPPAAGALTPTAAVANIFNIRVYILLLTVRDPVTAAVRNVMVFWDQKQWFIASQSVDLSYISTQEINSNITAWGTDGSSLFPLFDTPSASLTKRMATKLYGADNSYILKLAYLFYLQGQDLSGGSDNLDFDAVVDYEFGSIPVDSDINISFPALAPKRPLFACRAPDVYGVNLGLTLTSTSADFSVNYLGMGYTDHNGVLSASGEGPATGG